MDMKIYTVTTTGENGTRCWGFFREVAEANAAALANATDMNEAGYYPYLVIEEYPEGICQEGKAVQWYRWRGKRGGNYTPCRAPLEYLHISNFGMS